MGFFKRKPNIEELEEKGDVDGLSEALEHKDDEVRFKAIAALGRLKKWEPMVKAINDPADQNRALAAHHIGQIEINKHNKSDASLALIQLLNDSYVTTRYNAAESLYLIGDKRALEPIRQAFQTETDSTVRLSLQRAAERLMKA